MKNKIKIPKNLNDKQKSDISWIISVLTSCTEDSINSVNIYFKGYKIDFNYKINIKLEKSDKK